MPPRAKKDVPQRDWRPSFPEPGAPPQVTEPRDEQERARLQNELHAWEMRSLIHRAVHTNHPNARRRLASFASWMLHTSQPIRQPVRESGFPLF